MRKQCVVDYMKKIIVEYYDDTIKVIEDPFEIERIGSIISIITDKQEQEIISYLKQVDKYE